MRLGRIHWINAAPVYGALDRGIVATDALTTSGTAAQLNDLLAAGQLDVSVISAVEYARDARSYLLLPDLAISCDGPVHSVALFSKCPVEELSGSTVLTSSSSRTSVLLLDLLSRHLWNVQPHCRSIPAEPGDLALLQEVEHDAVLVIGDAALHLRAQARYPFMKDLGSEWKRWTGLPFVFAVWAARRDADLESVATVHQHLLQSRDWGLSHLDEIAMTASRAAGFPVETIRSYLGHLDYKLTPRHLDGLTVFFNRLSEDQKIPDGTLSFLSAA